MRVQDTVQDLMPDTVLKAAGKHRIRSQQLTLTAMIWAQTEDADVVSGAAAGLAGCCCCCGCCGDAAAPPVWMRAHTMEGVSRSGRRRLLICDASWVCGAQNPHKCPWRPAVEQHWAKSGVDRACSCTQAAAFTWALSLQRCRPADWRLQCR